MGASTVKALRAKMSQSDECAPQPRSIEVPAGGAHAMASRILRQALAGVITQQHQGRAHGCSDVVVHFSVNADNRWGVSVPLKATPESVGDLIGAEFG